MQRMVARVAAGLLMAGLLTAAVLMIWQPPQDSPPQPNANGPCSDLTELYEWYDCMNGHTWDRSGVVTSSLTRGRIRLGVKARTRRPVEQELARLGIPSHVVVIEEFQPGRTGSEMEPGDGLPVDFRLLTSEKRLPPYEEMQGLDIVMKLAENAEQFRQFWSLFQLTGEGTGGAGGGALPGVNWQTEAVLFVGLGESGSCPVKLDGLTLSPAGLLQAHLAYAGEYYACTDDYTPRTFVAAVRRESLPAGPIKGTVKNQFRKPVISLR